MHTKPSSLEATDVPTRTIPAAPLARRRFREESSSLGQFSVYSGTPRLEVEADASPSFRTRPRFWKKIGASSLGMRERFGCKSRRFLFRTGPRFLHGASDRSDQLQKFFRRC